MTTTNSSTSITEPSNSQLEDDFFAVKKPKKERFIPPTYNPNESWRDIKPDKSYMTVKKLYYQEQKKRKYNEMKKQQEEKIQREGKPSPNKYDFHSRKKFKPNTHGQENEQANLMIKSGSGVGGQNNSDKFKEMIS